MKETKEHKGFRIGQKVICILNNRCSLTIGKEYTIDGLDVYEDDDFWMIIKNDYGSSFGYHYTRFIFKEEFRKYLIDDILK